MMMMAAAVVALGKVDELVFRQNAELEADLAGLSWFLSFAIAS